VHCDIERRTNFTVFARWKAACCCASRVFGNSWQTQLFMRRRDFITIFGAAGILIGQSPVFAQTLRTYNCYDGSQFILAFFEGDKRAHLQLDGKAITLPKRIALSGSRYAKGDISLRITKTAITLKRGKQSTECITRSW
jgi:hypothetical protein